ncbi:MAG: DUF1249 domain-containing protein [Povalibacter sp.]
MNVADLQTDADCVVSWRSRPASFVSLMSLYESNYIRLRWLIEDLSQVTDPLVSTVEGDCPLHLKIEERSRYTTTLNLTYMFEEDAKTLADPDLQIRVYHDARLAEVQAAARSHRHSMLESLRASINRGLGDRWRSNMMLNKWLDYCVERGHRFILAPMSAPAP